MLRASKQVLTALLIVLSLVVLTEAYESPPGNPFIDDSPPPDRPYIPRLGEQYAKSADGWIPINENGVRHGIFYSPRKDGGYQPFFQKGGGGDTPPTAILLWRDVVITERSLPFPVRHGEDRAVRAYVNRIVPLPATPKAIEVEAPLQFTKLDKGDYRVGHFDPLARAFYWFDGYRVPKEKLPPTSPQHRAPILEFGRPQDYRLEPITIPKYLEARLKEFKSGETVLRPYLAQGPKGAIDVTDAYVDTFMHDGPVPYFQIGYVDELHKHNYPWKGITFAWRNARGEDHPLLITMNNDQKPGWETTEVDPPIFFLRLDENTLSPGYWTYEQFLPFEGITLKQDKLADQKEVEGMVLDPAERRFDLHRKLSIPIPQNLVNKVAQWKRDGALVENSPTSRP